MAIRAIRGYRTVSHAAATLLAGFPPLNLIANMYAQVFHNTRRARVERDANSDLVRESTRIKKEATARLMVDWKEWLTEPGINGARVREALSGKLDVWVGRKWGHITFRMAQVMTGHGCFGQYLCRIGRDPIPTCLYCGAESDDAQHTVAECVAWEEERWTLSGIIGEDLSLATIAQKMLEKEEAWTAFTKYCEVDMTAKENDERERRGEAPSAASQSGGRAPCRHKARGGPTGRRRTRGGDAPGNRGAKPVSNGRNS